MVISTPPPSAFAFAALMLARLMASVSRCGRAVIVQSVIAGTIPHVVLAQVAHHRAWVPGASWSGPPSAARAPSQGPERRQKEDNHDGQLHLLRIAGTDEHRPQAGEGHDDEGAGHEGSRLTARHDPAHRLLYPGYLVTMKVARASVTRQLTYQRASSDSSSMDRLHIPE
jgi:hypothetical protein